MLSTSRQAKRVRKSDSDRHRILRRCPTQGGTAPAHRSHGNSALDDPDLVAELAARRVPLTVCPLSNLRLCVVDDLASHPLRQMLEHDVLVTVNSDDPAYFGGYVNANYVAVAEALGLGAPELVRLARNSFEASWLEERDRAKLIDELAAVRVA